MKKILIAEDNKQITAILAAYAQKEGYEPLIALDGAEALAAFAKYGHEIAVCLLDVMMPEVDGFEVCRRLRRQSMVPIIMVTARSEDYDRIMGLDIGADDYVLKPFSASEVMARVRAVLRRVRVEEQARRNIFELGSLFIDMDKDAGRVGNSEVMLTKKEIEILDTMARNSSKTFTRDNLLESIWGFDYEGDSRTVDSHIKRLRAKLDAFPHPDWEIKTVWGKGYKFEFSR